MGPQGSRSRRGSRSQRSAAAVLAATASTIAALRGRACPGCPAGRATLPVGLGLPAVLPLLLCVRPGVALAVREVADGAASWAANLCGLTGLPDGVRRVRGGVC